MFNLKIIASSNDHDPALSDPLSFGFKSWRTLMEDYLNELGGPQLYCSIIKQKGVNKDILCKLQAIRVVTFTEKYPRLNAGKQIRQAIAELNEHACEMQNLLDQFSLEDMDEVSMAKAEDILKIFKNAREVIDELNRD
jgi:hypothetical protein